MSETLNDERHERTLATAKREWDPGTDQSTIEDAVREWANCRHAEVHDSGEVYIEDPQAGHYLRGERLAELVEWMRERGMLAQSEERAS